jgi:hypothetical protein
MEKNEMVFEPVTPPKFRSDKKRKIFFSGLFWILACALLISGIYTGDKLDIIGGVIFCLSFGMRLWDDYHLKPVKIICNPQGIRMQQSDHELWVEWVEVKKSVFNGRYLDFFVQSSIRHTCDLHPFSENQRSEILRLTENYLSGHGLTIKYLNKTSAVSSE